MGDKGPSADVKAKEQQITEGQLDLAKKSDARSEQLFQLGLPGLEAAKSHYEKIASGDPNAIFKETAPEAEAVKANATATKRNIDETMGRGGARDIAKAETDMAAAGQIGNMENKTFSNSFAALASLGSGSMGLSINEVANALAGFGGASNTVGQLGNQQAQGKASQLAFLGSLAGGVAEAAGAACWIAEALYGEHDLRTHLLRFWLNHIWAKQSRRGAVVMWFYRTLGRAVAKAIRLCPSLGRLFRWAFERGLARARAEVRIPVAMLTLREE